MCPNRVQSFPFYPFSPLLPFILNSNKQKCRNNLRHYGTFSVLMLAPQVRLELTTLRLTAE
ncbi:MAG: hypothetical protein WKF90_14820, partial [Pyrinomonadaceae bacterium]